MNYRIGIIVALIGFSTVFFAFRHPAGSDYAVRLERAEHALSTVAHKTHFLFSHGYIRNAYGIGKRQIKRFIKNNIFHGPAWFFEYNDSNERTNLAQSIDCATLAHAHEQLITTTHTDHCVLVGLSRGGSTAFMFTALHKPHAIKALILESPFAHVEDVAYQLGMQYIPWAPFKKQIALYVLRYLFPSFNPYHQAPVDVVHDIDHAIPVLFICSRHDDLVPAESTLRLVTALCNAGHPHVYSLVLDEGEHGYLSYNETVQDVTNAFLAQYNLDHDPERARAGAQLLHHCYQQPKGMHHDS